MVCPDTNVEQLFMISRTIAWPAACATHSRIKGLIEFSAGKSSTQVDLTVDIPFNRNFRV